MIPGRRSPHVLSLLAGREYGHRRNPLLTSQKILGTLVCGENYEFRKVWEKKSKSPIHFENDKIFLDNYQTAYAGYNVKGEPVNIFNIPLKQLPGSMKDGFLSQPLLTDSATAKMPTGDPGPKLYGITRFCLLVIDYRTGVVRLKANLLNPVIPFSITLSDISCSEPERQFIVSTSRMRTAPIVAGSSPPDTVKVIFVFSIQPLRFVCRLQIKRSVFGDDVTDVHLKEGLLFVIHRSSHVRGYDFNQLLQNHQVQYPPCLIESDCSHEQFSTSMTFTERPSCLFETKADGGYVQFGSNPWHYLRSPSCSVFHLHAVNTGHTAENGVLKTSCSWSVENDRAWFHSDESNRLIHIQCHQVRVLWVQQEKGRSVVTLHFIIPVDEHVLPISIPAFPKVTSSGRVVKQRFSIESLARENLTIHDVSYEDELEVLVVTSTVVLSHSLKGTTALYHNTTGTLLKSIALCEPGHFCMEHTTGLDKDTLVQVTKYSSSKFLVQVYRLTEKCAPSD